MLDIILKIQSNLEDFAEYRKLLDEFMLKLCRTENLKVNEQGTFEGLFDFQNITTNLKILETYYHKHLNPDDIDECFYIKEKKVSTPSKIPPFARQGAANKLDIPNGNNQNVIGSGGSDGSQGKKAFHSQRMLNYEPEEHMTMKSNLSEMKFTNRSVHLSPYAKTSVIPATPMTTALEMYNWISEKVKKSKKVILTFVNI